MTTFGNTPTSPLEVVDKYASMEEFLSKMESLAIQGDDERASSSSSSSLQEGSFRNYGELRVSMTSDFHWTWDNVGAGSKRKVSTWLAKSTPDNTLRPLGTTGVSSHVDPVNGQRGTILIGLNDSVPSDPRGPAVVPPIYYVQVWNDKKSGGTHNGTIWRPMAPTGYVACGDVGWQGYLQPPAYLVWCVRKDLVMEARIAETSTWDDKASGASMNCSMWEILPKKRPSGIDGSDMIPLRTDCFFTSPGYNKPKTTVYVVALQIPNDFKPYDGPPPRITEQTIPYEGKIYKEMEQCRVVLPLISFYDPQDQRVLDNIAYPFCTIARSIAWCAQVVRASYSDSSQSHTETVMYGLSKTQSQEIQQSIGVGISASVGVAAFNFEVSLNYQFSESNTHSFTEYKEKSVTDTFEVGPWYCNVWFSKQIFLKAVREDGITVERVQLTANSGLHLVGCKIAPRTDVSE